MDILFITAALAGALAFAAPARAADAEADRTSGPSSARSASVKDIYFAGGCFWGVEEFFSRVPGVRSVSSGYANGGTLNPTYEDVCSQRAGHAETVHVRYAPETVSLKTLTELFFTIIDPTSVNRQGNDRGVQYRTGIYFTDPADQSVIASVMQAESAKHRSPLVVEVGPLQNYSRAEDYHQQYLKKNPGGYCHIDFSSLASLKAKPEISPDTSPENSPGTSPEASVDASAYAKPSDAELKARLTPEAYSVTRRAGTEPPFTGQYWNAKGRGVYVDVTTGEPLFLSSDKFDSGTGWPSFTRPVTPEVVTRRQDGSHGMNRVEVRSRVGEAHLGHVFEDGPADKGGMRYCINSASLRFVPYDEMDKEGLGHLKPLIQ